MYNDIKLEKGLYNLSGKSFTAALEELDPTSAYCGTPLEKLDAFERQRGEVLHLDRIRCALSRIRYTLYQKGL